MTFTCIASEFSPTSINHACYMIWT